MPAAEDAVEWFLPKAPEAQLPEVARYLEKAFLFGLEAQHQPPLAKRGQERDRKVLVLQGGDPVRDARELPALAGDFQQRFTYPVQQAVRPKGGHPQA